MPIKRDRPPLPFAGNLPDAGEPGVILIPELIGREIRRLRTTAGLFQQDLAAALNWPQSMVSRLERGDARVALDQLYAVCYALADHFALAGNDPPEPHEIMERVNGLALDLAGDGYELTWASATEWPEPARLVRGPALEQAIEDAKSPTLPL